MVVVFWELHRGGDGNDNWGVGLVSISVGIGGVFVLYIGVLVIARVHEQYVKKIHLLCILIRVLHSKK